MKNWFERKFALLSNRVTHTYNMSNQWLFIHLPGRASYFFDRTSLHELHTRTGASHPLAGTAI